MHEIARWKEDGGQFEFCLAKRLHKTHLEWWNGTSRTRGITMEQRRPNSRTFPPTATAKDRGRCKRLKCYDPGSR
jgi:hypothetical protein